LREEEEKIGAEEEKKEGAEEDKREGGAEEKVLLALLAFFPLGFVPDKSPRRPRGSRLIEPAALFPPPLHPPPTQRAGGPVFHLGRPRGDTEESAATLRVEKEEEEEEEEVEAVLVASSAGRGSEEEEEDAAAAGVMEEEEDEKEDKDEEEEAAAGPATLSCLCWVVMVLRRLAKRTCQGSEAKGSAC